MKNLVSMLVALMLVLGVVTVAQAASCTGKCWVDSSGVPYCGFTAMTEGSRCVDGVTSNGIYYCEEYACSGGGGPEPENKTDLGPQDDLLLCEVAASESQRTRTAASVRVLEPRT